MHLYVVRHGKARRESESGLDRDRVLRPRGHRQAAFLASELAAAGAPPQRVLSSPYARAAETAAPIAEALALEVEYIDVLASHPPSTILDLIADFADRDAASMAMVGHNPTLSVIVSLLTEGIGRGSIELRTGQAAEIELPRAVEPGAGTLRRLIRLEED